MSQRLTCEERIEIVLMSGDRSNWVIAADFNARHPTRPPISHATVSKLLAKFCETGSVLDLPKCGRMKTVTNEETSVAVLASFSKSPQRSTRCMSLESGISRTSLWRILATHKWHPYKLQLLQHLNEDDPDRRTEFAEWAKQKLEQDPQFTQKILFSDEANFYVNGEVNKQNHRYWSDTNPHWIDPSKTVGTKKFMVPISFIIPTPITMSIEVITIDQRTVTYRVVSMPGDGTYLFHSLCYILHGHIRLTLDIRRNIVSYVLNDWDRFKVWTDDGTGDNYTTQEHYKSEMLKPFTYGSACQAVMYSTYPKPAKLENSLSNAVTHIVAEGNSPDEVWKWLQDRNVKDMTDVAVVDISWFTESMRAGTPVSVESRHRLVVSKQFSKN
ncbi:TDT nucleotidylexotransferase, partial [Polypterus senegalus]